MPLLQRDSLTTYIIFIFPLFLLAIIAAWNTLSAGTVGEGGIEIGKMATKQSNQNLNGENND